MADLTDEMKEFLNSNLAWVATISKEGQIDLGPKMSTFIIDSSHIGYHERTAGQTYRNLLDGSDLVYVRSTVRCYRNGRSRIYSISFAAVRPWIPIWQLHAWAVDKCG